MPTGPAIAGHCVNISDSGLLGEFTHPLELWTEGELTLHFGEGVSGLKARVARVIGNVAGLVFLSGIEAVPEIVAAARLDMQKKGHRAAPPF